MQSNVSAPVENARPAVVGPALIGCTAVLFGVVPLFGLLAELTTGMLSEVLPLFPTWWHVVGVGLAVCLNFALHFDLLRGKNVLVRAGATGFTLGMAMLYAVAEAPAVPAMVMLAVVGLGVLAAAPYFVLLGMPRLVAKLWREWQASGRTQLHLAAILLVLGALPLTLSLVDGWSRNAVLKKLTALSEVMQSDGQPEREEALARELRGLDIATQRSICVTGSQRSDEASWLMTSHSGWRHGHLANHHPFWFVANLARCKLPREDARRAFHRAHGEAFDDGELPIEAIDRYAGAALEWRTSKITASLEPAAALAKVDWELKVGSSSRSLAEARFDIRLPTGAVASSLSLWIGGVERPAAFAAASKVEAAFESVVAKMRDPALLQEIGPDLLRLRLFPVVSGTPMQVRVGLTLPLCLRGEKALLQLPQVVGHNCGGGRMADHMVRVEGLGVVETVPFSDQQLRLAIPVPRTDRTVFAPDADGFVVQRLRPRTTVATNSVHAPSVVVLEASASVGRAIADPSAFLASCFAAPSLQPSKPCIVFLVVGRESRRFELQSGNEALSPSWLSQPFAGGVDARNAVTAAMQEAKALGQHRIYWLHGAMADWQESQAGDIPSGVEVATLALDPGRNVLRDSPWLKDCAVTVPRLGTDADSLRQSLVDFERFHTIGAFADSGDTERRFSRASKAPEGAAPVSDQLARLWAARQARALAAAGDDDAAAQLAARYRLVTAGSGAVVLERSEQYEQHGLDPGALVGREPDGAIGSLPIAEPSTFILLGSGLLFVMWWMGRRDRSKPATG